MKGQVRVLRAFSLLLLIGLTACSKGKPSPVTVVADLKQKKSVATDAVATAAAGRDTTKVETEITFRKAALLNRAFLYGASLQFSSVVDGDIKTAMMGLELGQVPANFRVMNSTLQLLTDSSINFESDVNHPSRLVHEFDIVRQDEETLTILVKKPSPVIDTFMFGNDNKVPLRTTWNRSAEFVDSDELLMIESSVELQNGSIGEFMETLRPREKQVPADVKPIFNDADLNDNAERFRFLDTGDVYLPKPSDEKVRIKTKVAERWLLKNGEPVRWYVTSNIPDQYFNDVKNAVEGWNRYSRAAGQPDLIKFMGKIPDGVKVGDPRYNLIIWDTVQEAGAAYESQNADPVSGIQEHSMIYIPLAWINIGKDYWTKMRASEGPSQGEAISKLLSQRSFLGRKLPVHCMDKAEMHVSLKAKESPEEFARGLLKGVVFHEVGHSFGLAHNFKGSLSFDPDDGKKAFSTSIMDYNDYNEEVASFSSVDSSDGPLLEYDRQIISVLYNEGKDVRDSDPKLPTCNDDEADSTADGVDPLCLRYDIGSDPTKQALRMLDLVSKVDARSGRMRSLPLALTESLEGLTAAAEVKTLDEAKAALKQATTNVQNIASIYLGASANSLGYIASASLKSLKVFQKGALLDGYSESGLRENALSLLAKASAMSVLPEASKQAVASQKAAILAYLSSTAAVSSLGRAEQDKAMADFAAQVDKALASAENAVLSKMRTRLINTLANTPTAPMALQRLNGTLIDIEVVAMGVLEQLSSAKAGAFDRPLAERTAAVKALKTYSGSETYKAFVDRVRAGLTLEIHNSTDALQRQELRKILEILS